VSEAGVGKSRLLYEFRKAVTNEDVTFLEGKCLSYSRGVAYHPIIDLFKSNFDIRENDEDDQIKEKVKNGLKQLKVEKSSTLPYLLELLSVKDSGIDQIPMSPEARKDRMMETMKRIPLKGSEIRPLIMAIEDLHWIDKSSEEALKYLLESISGARVLLIFTYRPEFVHTWGGRSYHNQINLNRLSNRESLAMVTYLLDTQEIETDLEILILEKTEGVPFFIEEFLKSLRDIKVIERKDNSYYLTKDIKDVTIPSSIQDMIMARVDSLLEGAKEVLQIGSVIEREFNYELIKDVTSLPEKELMSHLSALKDSELLFERGIFPQSAYIFKHALTQEVVYDSILTKRKKELHDEIGQAIEELYKDNIDEHYGILAEHYIEADSYEKGAEYSRLTQRKAEKTGSLDNAIVYAQKRISCLERLPKTDEAGKRIIDARTSLGLYFLQFARVVEAKEAIDPIIDLTSKSSYKRRLSQIYTIMGTYDLYVEENFSKAFKQLKEALKIAEELNDTLSLVMANYWLGIVLSHNCEFEKSLYYLEKALNINVAANSLWGIVTLKGTIGMWVYHHQGRINLGYQTTKEAIQLAEESGDIFSKAVAYGEFGHSCFLMGFLKEAEEHALKCVDFSERINFLHGQVNAHFYLGEIYFEIGEYQKSKDHYGKVIEISELNRFWPSNINLCKLGVAKAKVMNNEKDVDLESITKYATENKVRLFDGWMPRYIDEVSLNIDDHHMAEAEEWINKAIEADTRNGMMWYLGRDYALYAELLKRKRDQSKARENLTKAIEIFKECGADGWVERAEKELASLS